MDDSQFERSQYRLSETGQRRLDLLEEENLRLRLKLSALESSRSWRLTAPLRRLADFLRRRKLLPQINRIIPGVLLDNYYWRDDPAESHHSRIKVVAHVFYLDLVDEIAATVARCGNVDGVVVTYVRSDALDTLRVAFERHSLNHVNFVLVENRGRDFLPFMTTIQLGFLDNADFVLKIHTKKSLHLESSQGRHWRQSLLFGLVPSTRQVANLITDMSSRSDVAWACPDEWIAGNESWGRNKANVRRLLARLNLRRPRRLIFPAGSMFWMSNELIQAFKELNVTADDFVGDEELDGSLGHSLERFVGSWAVSQRKCMLRLRSPSD